MKTYYFDTDENKIKVFNYVTKRWENYMEDKRTNYEKVQHLLRLSEKMTEQDACLLAGVDYEVYIKEKREQSSIGMFKHFGDIFGGMI